MNKINSVEWHMENLKNMKSHIEREQNYVNSQEKRLSELISNASLLDLQINVAIREGKKNFDSDKFLIKRNKTIKQPIVKNINISVSDKDKYVGNFFVTEKCYERVMNCIIRDLED